MRRILAPAGRYLDVLNLALALADADRDGRIDELVQEFGIVPLARLDVRHGGQPVIAGGDSSECELAVRARPDRLNPARLRDPERLIRREQDDAVVGRRLAGGVLNRTADFLVA